MPPNTDCEPSTNDQLEPENCVLGSPDNQQQSQLYASVASNELGETGLQAPPGYTLLLGDASGFANTTIAYVSGGSSDDSASDDDDDSLVDGASTVGQFGDPLVVGRSSDSVSDQDELLATEASAQGEEDKSHATDGSCGGSDGIQLHQQVTSVIPKQTTLEQVDVSSLLDRALFRELDRLELEPRGALGDASIFTKPVVDGEQATLWNTPRNDDTLNITEDVANQIRACMANFRVPEPDWAVNLSDESLRQMLAERAQRHHQQLHNQSTTKQSLAQ